MKVTRVLDMRNQEDCTPKNPRRTQRGRRTIVVAQTLLICGLFPHSPHLLPGHLHPSVCIDGNRSGVRESVEGSFLHHVQSAGPSMTAPPSAVCWKAWMYMIQVLHRMKKKGIWQSCLVRERDDEDRANILTGDVLDRIATVPPRGSEYPTR